MGCRRLTPASRRCRPMKPIIPCRSQDFSWSVLPVRFGQSNDNALQKWKPVSGRGTESFYEALAATQSYKRQRVKVFSRQHALGRTNPSSSYILLNSRQNVTHQKDFSQAKRQLSRISHKRQAQTTYGIVVSTGHATGRPDITLSQAKWWRVFDTGFFV